MAAALAAGAVAGPAVPNAVAQSSAPAASASTSPFLLRDYGPPPSWSTRKGICSPVSLGDGAVRHGLPPSASNIVMTSIRITSKRKVTCTKARTAARRYFVKGQNSGYKWRNWSAYGRDDGKGAQEYRGTRGGRRITFIASN